MAVKKIKLLKEPALPERAKAFRFLSFLNQKLAAIIIGLVAFTFYITSVNGEYALDDGIIIHQNDHVVKGLRGIKDILTKDAYESFYRRMCASEQLAGGRYRPLSAVSFAIEQQFIGAFRTGLYTKVEDSNRNGQLDTKAVTFTNTCGRSETNFEYNDFVDQNWDNQPQLAECYSCWDRNKNFKNEIEEDVNQDGIYNEVDCHLYGASVRHFNNILFFVVGCVLLYLVFSNFFFRTNPDLAFFSALLFTMHLVHSEAIANVKSRDEIFSLIFIALTFLFVYYYLIRKNNSSLFWCCIMFLLALLSKEYAIMMLFLVPIAVYTFTLNDFDVRTFFKAAEFRKSALVTASFVVCAVCMTYIKRDFDINAMPTDKPTRAYWFFPFLYIVVAIYFTGVNKKNNFLKLQAWLFFIMLFYIGMRWMAVKLKPGVPDTEILNNPYLLADGEERFCTKVYVLLKYIKLQVFPHPLSSDYSFDSIPYRHFTSWDFILSLFIHLAMPVVACYYTLKKHILGFALWTYILFGLLIANVVMDIGATMGERLIFHASIGFCIGVSYLILELLERMTSVKIFYRRAFLVTFIVIIGVLFCIKTWERNFDWKNDVTLFLKDVKTMPNSVLCLGNAGARYVDLSSTKDILGTKLEGYDTTFNDYNGTLKNLEEEVKLGKYRNKREAAMAHGVEVLTRAVHLHPRYVNGYLNLGLLYLQQQKDYETIFYLKNAERLYPNNPYLRNYYGAYGNQLRNRASIAFQRGRMDSVAIAYNLLTLVEPTNAENWFNLGGAFYNQGKFELAQRSWQKALKINPNYHEVKKLMGMIPVGQQPLKN